MTTAGMYATIRALTDDTVDLEVSPGVVVTYAKQAVARVVEPASDAPTPEPDA